eukprot:CAMPEP_0113684010 /NCGR_PEP_ID=MMETSP0038_2-20120614/13708_1 /TAXON_ID=2898 /ORGANISM="Cryptomonas paramecium" /LENGTH=65 /DNA_ID=CAMNT_0000603597 /DNA_START=324 /DNA_END=521 /DNA_ORIENTATION=- /assembly_acc=CAM_ASM_000170
MKHSGSRGIPHLSDGRGHRLSTPRPAAVTEPTEMQRPACAQMEVTGIRPESGVGCGCCAVAWPKI